MSSIKRININPNDIQKISKELILYITLKDGTILVSDNNIPSQDINQLINNKEENILHSHKQNSAIFNYKNKTNINNSYNKINEKEKVLSTNESNNFNPHIIKDLNNFNKSSYKNFYTLNVNKSSSKNIEENKNDIYQRNDRMDFKSQNQSISDIVNEKFQKKFKNNNTKENKMPIKPTINSEIKINIKGKESEHHRLDNLINDFNELLTNFNYKKKGIQNNTIDRNKYKYYKKTSMNRKDKLFLENLSSITPNSRTIKYIGRNENNITELYDKNLFGNNFTNNKVSYLKDKQPLKRNKSNQIYFLKMNKFSNLISPPNYLHCKKMKFL